jgi:hypothetical protein
MPPPVSHATRARLSLVSVVLVSRLCLGTLFRMFGIFVPVVPTLSALSAVSASWFASFVCDWLSNVGDVAGNLRVADER